jgi:ABC-type anion transport system duplicated permease subunit
MLQFGKMIVLMGVILIVIGAAIWLAGRMDIRGLPGDVAYESDRVHVYFPWVTCLVISALLTLMMWIWRRAG